MPIIEEKLDEDFIDEGNKPLHDPVIEELLGKYSASRGELETDLADITKLKEHLGITVPIIDTMISGAKKGGALGAKIVGSGGGGCIVALAHKANEENVINVDEVLKYYIF